MTETKKKPTSKRQADERLSRRRRDPVKGAHNFDGRMKLSVDPALLDPNYEHRWINDTGGRMAQKFGEDWDPVTPEMLNGGEAPDYAKMEYKDIETDSIVKRSNGNGNVILCRKPKNFYDDDRAPIYKDLEDTDRQIKQGVNPKSEQVGNSYIPDEGQAIRITRSNKPSA